MCLQPVLLLAAGLLLGAETPQTDADKFQGTWAVATAEKDGQPDELFKSLKITITAEKLATTVAGKAEEANYKLDPAKKPKQIDIRPIDAKDEVLRGIYTFEGDDLKICFRNIGKERPTEFVTKPDTDTVLLVLKREKQ